MKKLLAALLIVGGLLVPASALAANPYKPGGSYYNIYHKPTGSYWVAYNAIYGKGGLYCTLYGYNC